MDEDPTSNTSAGHSTGTGGVTDDLAGLFGPSTSTSTALPSTTSYPKASNADILGMFNQPPIGAATSMAQPRPMGFNPSMQTHAQIGATPPPGYQPQVGVGPIMLPGTPQQQPKGLALGGNGSRTGTPSLGTQTSPPTSIRGTSTSVNTSTTGTGAGAAGQKDPFADLAGLF
jgi:hypothetical protein